MLQWVSSMFEDDIDTKIIKELQNTTGDSYYDGNGRKYAYTKAVKSPRIDMLTYTGDCYFYGTDVPQNYAKAVEYYLLSVSEADRLQGASKADRLQGASEGNLEAMNNLGICYLFGYGVDKNAKKALKYFKSSAMNGNTNGQGHLATYYYYVEKDHKKSFEHMQSISDKHNANVLHSKGIIYLQQQNNEQEPNVLASLTEKALECFRQSARKYNLNALFELGDWYFHGYGVPKNKKKAIQFWKLSSCMDDNCVMNIDYKKGNQDAQLKLGDYYHHREEYAKAMRCYLLSSDTNGTHHGLSEAQWKLGDYYFGRNLFDIFDCGKFGEFRNQIGDLIKAHKMYLLSNGANLSNCEVALLFKYTMQSPETKCILENIDPKDIDNYIYVYPLYVKYTWFGLYELHKILHDKYMKNINYMPRELCEITISYLL